MTIVIVLCTVFLNIKGINFNESRIPRRVFWGVGLKRSDHVTPILKNLLWLPVEKRIEFKILLITYKTIHSQSVDYPKPLIEM